MSALLLDRIRAREELRARIESTIAHINQRAGELTAEAIIAEIQADADEVFLQGVAAGQCSIVGPNMGAAVFADLTGNLSVSDAELARRFGVTPQAVSKILIRVRRNLGLPVREPTKARHPRTKPAALI